MVKLKLRPKPLDLLVFHSESKQFETASPEGLFKAAFSPNNHSEMLFATAHICEMGERPTECSD